MHHNDIITIIMVSQITSYAIVYSTTYSRGRSKKTSKLCVTGLCEGNSLVTSEFHTQRASNEEMFPFDDFIMGSNLLGLTTSCKILSPDEPSDDWIHIALLYIEIALIQEWMENAKKLGKYQFASQANWHWISGCSQAISYCPCQLHLYNCYVLIFVWIHTKIRT